jgi:NADPH2:quinone reductase
VDRVVPLHAGADLTIGACLGVPYLTAHLCAFDAAVGACTDGREQTALVTGGAGAVGAAAVQLLRWSGARVIATVSTEEKAVAAVSAGAEHVIRYRDEDVAGRLQQLAPEGLGRVVDVALAANLDAYAESLAHGAVVAAYAGGSTRPEVPMRAFMRRNAGLKFVHVYGADPRRLEAAIRDVSDALADGALAPVATTVLPLDRIVEAHELLESGPFGRVLLDIGDPSRA